MLALVHLAATHDHALKHARAGLPSAHCAFLPDGTRTLDYREDLANPAAALSQHIRMAAGLTHGTPAWRASVDVARAHNATWQRALIAAVARTVRS